MDIQTRRDLATYLEDRMTRSSSQLREKQRLEYDTSLVKTYLLEVHPSGDGSHESIVAYMKQVIEGEQSPFASARFRQTEEEHFFQLHIQAKKGEVDLYIDATTPRFWIVHSMEGSAEVDWCIERLSRATPEFDTFWLPVPFLEWAAKTGMFSGLGLDFDARDFITQDIDSDQQVGYLKMQLWGNRAGDILSTLRQAKAFPHETTLSKVKVRFSLDDESYSVDDIKFNGKITARGTSFQCHQTLVTNIQRRYADALRDLEYRARIIHETEGSRWRIKGSPVTFRFRAPVKDASILCERLFRCVPPFRLWGVPVRFTDDCFHVAAVDLHVGHPLDFEIGKDWMRVYLHEHSCGNTIIRLWTNLQHTVDSEVEAEIDGEPIYVFQSPNG